MPLMELKYLARFKHGKQSFPNKDSQAELGNHGGNIARRVTPESNKGISNELETFLDLSSEGALVVKLKRLIVIAASIIVIIVGIAAVLIVWNESKIRASTRTQAASYYSTFFVGLDVSSIHTFKGRYAELHFIQKNDNVTKNLCLKLFISNGNVFIDSGHGKRYTSIQDALSIQKDLYKQCDTLQVVIGDPYHRGRFDVGYSSDGKITMIGTLRYDFFPNV